MSIISSLSKLHSSYQYLVIYSIVLVFIYYSSNILTHAIYGQLQTNNTLGVNITSPDKGQSIPINSSLTVSGKSTDNPATDDCQVSVIVNSIKPYQPATANGTTGQEYDYSKWIFILNSNYTSITEGLNEITARLSCPSSVTNTNLTKWYGINVTGVAAQAQTSASIPQALTPKPNQEEIVQGEGQQQIPLPLSPETQGLFGGNITITESMNGGNEADIIEGSTSPDDINGGNGDDRIRGSVGDDKIDGSNGDDYIQGNEGGDTLIGNNGDDLLFGDNGDDYLEGGNGADKFSCGGGIDTITDFSAFQGDVKSGDCESS